MTEENKSKRGGFREGAGRKPTGRQYHVMSITGTKEDLDVIRNKAEKAGKSISKYVIDLVKEN